MKRPDVALAIHPGVHTDAMMTLWRPTLQLLAKEHVPLAMTTYNQAEFEETIEVHCTLLVVVVVVVEIVIVVMVIVTVTVTKYK